MDWFLPNDTIGITAGTSTPDNLINEVEQQLRQTRREQHEQCLV
jgi:4-hydroxy-3-methylbut-2-enyl diphosphate reductase IspH